MLGPLIAVLFILGAGAAWLFFAFPPPFANKKQVGVFNMTVLGVTALLCLAWAFNIKVALKGTPDEEFTTQVVLAGCLAIEFVFVGICFLLRNFWIFKQRRGPRY